MKRRPGNANMMAQQRALSKIVKALNKRREQGTEKKPAVKNEDMAANNAGNIHNPAVTVQGPRPQLGVSVTDRRRRKDKPPVVLKRFRKYNQ